jgi:hypothetical protein
MLAPRYHKEFFCARFKSAVNSSTAPRCLAASDFGEVDVEKVEFRVEDEGIDLDFESDFNFLSECVDFDSASLDFNFEDAADCSEENPEDDVANDEGAEDNSLK